MASCVDTKAAARYVAENGLDVAPDLIKHLVFKWQLENNTETEWPSKEYILNNIQGESFEASDVQRELYNKLGLNEVKTFPTESARTQYIENYLKNNGTYCFPEKSIYLYSGAKGDFKLSVGRPTNFNELEAIKERAIADGTFMKAPNGQPTNLSERQWLHVRTKAFKEWFGDWERLAPRTRNDQFFTTPTDATPRLIERIEHIAESSDKYGRLAKIILDNKLLPYNLRYFKVDNNRSDIRSYKKEVPGLAGSWSSVASYIEVLGNNAPEEAVNRVILHELIHFNTEALLDEYKRSPNSIPENQRAAIAELYNIIDYAKSHLKEDIKNNPSKYKEIRDRQGNPLSTRVFYAFDGHTDVEIDEFISEVFTNPAFQEVLNNIPYKTDKKKSIWNKIIDAITSIFGLPIKQGSVLEAALRESSLFLSKENSLTEISRNTSKVVDENGEPLVVYHYTTEQFDTFDISFFGQSDQGDVGRGFYFTTYSPEDNDFFLKAYGNVVMPVFLNIKNPVPFKEVNELDINGRKIGKVSILNTSDFNREFPNKPLRDVLQRKLNSIKYELEDIDYKLSGKDEFFINDEFHNQILNGRKEYLIQKALDLEKQLRETPKEELDKSIYADRNTLDEYDGVFNTNFEIVVKDPNQIKSATDNNGEYSNESNNIYEDSDSFHGEYSRFDLGKKPTLRQKIMHNALKLIEAKQWNLTEEQQKQVADALTHYMEEKGKEIVYDVTPEHIYRYFGNNDQTTAANILDYIIKNSTDKSIVQLAKYVAKNLGNSANTKVSWNSQIAGKPRGRRLHTGSIIIFGTSFQGRNREHATNNMEQTIIHEIAHDITIDRLDTDSEAQKEVLQIYKDFTALAEQYDIDLGYAGKNAKEFVAEFLARKEFREALKLLPAQEGKKTIYQRVLDFLKNILGIKTTDTFFDRADKAIEKLLDTVPSVELEEAIAADTFDDADNGPIPVKYTGKDAVNQDLSNFASRRFTVDMSSLGIGLGNFTAESVEQAYQWCKFIYPILLYKGQNGWTDANRVNQLTAAANAIASLGTNSSAIQNSGKNGLRLTEAERSFWEANKHNIMYALMYNSFQQNPQAKKRLLDTGDRPFTHPVTGEWRTKFPELLAQVRQELRGSRLQHATQNWTRESAEKDPRTLYIFTDNTDRTSGRLPVNPNSWYARRYGANAKYPTMTQAVLRGLDNARPISTVKMFYSLHKGVTNPRQDKNSKALWTDADLPTAMKVIDAEFQDIFDAWNELDANGKPKYDRIVLGPGDGILNGEISNITEQRTPRLYKYFQLKLQELAQVVDGKLVNMNDIANRSAAYGVTIDGNLKRSYVAWQESNPSGIVAYRKYSGNKESFTLETVLEGWIGNPFSIKDRGPKTVQQFYDWIITGNNFGNEFATEEFRHSIIAKILASPDNAPVLYYTELNRPSHATVLGYLIRNKHLLPKPQGQLVGYTNHSGGAKGSDSYWTVYGAKRGTVSNNYYHQDRTPLGNVEQSQADFTEGTSQAKQASASMKRYWNDKYGNLLARNWNQVKYADAVFAIGHIVQPGEKNSRGYSVQTVQVDGGTGYAVQMAMNAGKPVYVFDQTRQHWYKYENGTWHNSDTPILSRNFAGIGTREINEAGKKAIEDVYAKTAEYEASRNTFEPVQSKNDPERFADKKESEKVISSDKTILTNEELKYWNEHGVGEKPRILSASERTDPAFHVKEILDILNGKKTVPEWGIVNGKRQKIGEVTGKDFAGLYLITKHDGLPMLDLLETKIPKLIHFSITTLGGTKYEPGVMKYNDLLDRIQEYLNKGLDPDAVTIRIDPIVPGVTNFKDIENVVRRASQMGIKRIRFSVMDAYTNTREAMKDIYDFNKYYNGFHAKPEYINEISDFMLQMKEKYDIRLGTCAEPLVKPGIMQDGCLSVAAINEMLGTNIEDRGKLNNTQRPNCSCYGGKIDALAYNSKCASHCIYCYAKHENDKAISYYDEDGYLRDNIYTRTTREPIKPKPSIPIIESNEVVNEAEQNNDPIANNVIWRQIEQDPEYQQSVKLDTQLRTLTETLGIPMSKIEEVAAEIGNFLSDVITEIQKDPESIMDQIEMDGSKSLPITKGLSRMEIISRIGPDRLLNYIKETKFDTAKFDMKQWDNQAFIDETDAFYNNWDILVNRALITILENEKVKFVKNEKTGALEAQEGKLDTDPDDFSGQAEQDEVEETHANQQEWGIENKSVDLLNDVASPLVRDAFRQCYDLDENGSVIQSERGINKRRRMRDAMQSVLSWTANSQTLSEATEKLKEKAKKETWLQPIVRRLEDTSGKESDFQNQIWTVLCNANVVYTVVKRQGKKWITVDVSSKPARKEQLRQIKALFKMGEHPLFTQNGISLQNLSNYSAAFSALKDVKESRNKGQTFENKELFNKAVTNIGYIANLLGFFAPKELIQENLTDENFTEIYNNIDGILRRLDNYKGDPNYDPFKVKNEDESFYAGGIANYLQNLLTPLTASLEDSHITTIFDNGKMYQTRVKPSALLLHIAKFHLDDAKFMQFILDNYAGLPWYRDQSEPDPTKGWRNAMLGEMVNNKEVRENFRHHVQLNFNKKQYMKNMNPVEYTLASIAEFFAANPLKKTTGNVYANFRMTIQSNKPTSEYLTMKCVTGPYYKETIVDQMSQIFDQELTRIQTLQYLNAKKGDAKYIKNFSEQGKKFCLVDFMNVYLEGGKRANTELGKLLRDKLDGKKIDEGRFLELKKGAIMQQMDARIQTIIDGWKADGTMEEAKSIANIKPSQIEKSLEFFAWNDAIATMNIMEIFVTDPAYYKGADDLQKRLAELHAPGIRPNIEARDYKGEKLSDGTHRSVSLVDHDKYVSNIIDNLDVVFSRKIAEAKDKPAEREGWIALKNRLIGKDGLFRTEINVTDGQAYNCPTSFRKKAFMFGKWNRHKEEIYQRIRKGDYNYTDVESAFQDAIGPTFGVLKPTTFGHSIMETGAPAPLLNKISVPTYNKNSEYALIIADAILQGEETGKPNLLRAIYEVMEESHFDENGNYKQDGIDTIQFISAIKSGEGKSVDIIQFKDTENGEEKAKAFLRQNIYADAAAGTYNKDVVRELPFDSFALQMDVANHFQNHEQIFGSQDRMIIPSELPEVDINGETILYKTPKHPEGVTAKEFRKEYEETLAKNIEQSVDLLEEELGLKSLVPIDRKFAISKLLRREILSNPRYGLDLYTALSIDAVKQDFRIPLGDPVNSKRVESLLNSIIKDRVNKQKIAGGPVVQVTNFGTSKQLNIRFKHKNGGLLKTREEYAAAMRENDPNVTEKHIDWQYNEYRKRFQGGIAYMEVYASPYVKDIFEQFADAEGNIDIANIEKVNPELLKMIGYRIPTEAKYSISPLKIVGFLPRIAGEAIMMPYEITLLNGSDFDVDKMYLMTKKLNITKKQITNREISKAIKSLENIATINITEDGEIQTNATLKDIKKAAKIGLDFAQEYPNSTLFDKDKNSLVNRLARAINLKKLITPEEEYNLQRKYNDDMEFNLRRFKVRKGYASAEPSTYGEDIELDAETRAEAEPIIAKERQRLEEIRDIDIDLAREAYRASKVKERIKQFLNEDRFMSSKYDDEITAELRKAYLDFTYKVEEPTSEKELRDNAAIDMQWEILTHEATASEILNPGGFDPQKKMGYAIDAYKKRATKKNGSRYTWDELMKLSIDDLKDLSTNNVSLMFFDTQAKYYKQNSAAGSLTGIFAVHRTAFATLENDGLLVDVNEACGLTSEKVIEQNGTFIKVTESVPFKVAGIEFGGEKNGKMLICKRFDTKGGSVGKSLGSSVAAAVDAGKVPVLNLMNINGTTANTYLTMLKMGIPFETAAIFLGQQVISDLLEEHARKNVGNNYAGLYELIDEKIADFAKQLGIGEGRRQAGTIDTEDLTESQMVDGLINVDARTAYKTLTVLKNFMKLSNAMRLPVAATRLNSINSAVGPLVTNNIIEEIKRINLTENSCIYAPDGVTKMGIEDIINLHPILREFYKAYDVADRAFADMPANSNNFRRILNTLSLNGLDRKFFRDPKLMTALSDFYQTYLAYASGALKHKELKQFIEEFPRTFVKRRYKDMYKDNKLIQAIQFNTEGASELVTLNIDTTGQDESYKSPLRSAWADLYKSGEHGKKLAISLAKYFMYRGGVGFSPKTALSLLPVEVKEQIPHYTDSFKNSNAPVINASAVIDMFIRNNCSDNRLVPPVSYDKLEGTFQDDTFTVTTEEAIDKFNNRMYFKTKINGQDVVYRKSNEIMNGQNVVGIEYTQVPALGNNKAYVEISLAGTIKEAKTPSTIEDVDSSQEEFVPEDSNAMEYSDNVVEPESIEFPSPADMDTMLRKVFENSGFTVEAAKAHKDVYGNNQEQLAAYKDYVHKFIETRLGELGINVGKEQERLINELTERIC